MWDMNPLHIIFDVYIVGVIQPPPMDIICLQILLHSAVNSSQNVQEPKTRYPVVVWFAKVNYANISTKNYALDEIEEVKA
ncbi:unnamed protein product [Brassica oleracea]